MKPMQARKLAKQTKPAYMTIKRAIEALEGEIDPLLVFCRETLVLAYDKTKQSVEALNKYEGN